MIEESVFDSFKFPTSWQMEKLRRVFSNTKTLTGRQLPLLGANVALGVTERYEGDGRPAASEDLSKYKVVEVHDIIMNPLGKPHGSIGRSNLVGITSPAYWVLRCNTGFEPRYAHYLLRSEVMINEYKRRSKNLPPNQFDLPWEQFREIEIGFPSLQEQRRIADYLGEFSARLEEILLAKRNYIERLGELYLRRIAQITSGASAETMSLLPGWQLQKISWNFKTGSGTTPTSNANEFFDGPITWINSGDLNDGLVTESSKSVTELAIRTFSALKVYEPGALLIAMYGATVGKTGLLGVPACVNQAVCVLAPIGKILPEFARYWFFANRSSFMDQSVGGGQPNINQDILRSQRIPFPDLVQQEKLVKQLDDETEKHLRMKKLVEKSIEQISNYRTSLITSAVTGTFDVTTGRSVA